MAGRAEAHQFGDVGDMVTGALDVLGHEHEMRARGDRARILHHVGQQLAEKAGVDLVDLFVALPHVASLGHVAVRERIEHVLQRGAHQPSEPLDAGHRRSRRRRLAEHDAALGGVLGIVGDALERRRDLDRRQDDAQVDRHRLTQRQQTHGLLLDRLVERVDAGIVDDHLLGRLGIAFAERRQRPRELAFRQAAHLADRGAQPLQLLVEPLQGMFGHGLSLLFFVVPAQPNRPVM